MTQLAKRLSADAVNVSISTSSVTKGETLLDTALTEYAASLPGAGRARRISAKRSSSTGSPITSAASGAISTR